MLSSLSSEPCSTCPSDTGCLPAQPVRPWRPRPTQPRCFSPAESRHAPAPAGFLVLGLASPWDLSVPSSLRGLFPRCPSSDFIHLVSGWKFAGPVTPDRAGRLSASLSAPWASRSTHAETATSRADGRLRAASVAVACRRAVSFCRDARHREDMGTAFKMHFLNWRILSICRLSCQEICVRIVH